MDFDNPQFVQFTNKAEIAADALIKHSRTILPTLGRLFLTSTFIEDGLRMWIQWSDQRDYIAYHWDLPMFLGTIFVVFNLLAQLGGSGMVLFRKNVRVACGVLLSVVITQTVAYNVLWTPNFFFRNLSLVGGLALLFTETFESGRKSLFAGLPSLDSRGAHVNYIQLFGRVTLVFMFLTIQRWEMSFFYLIETAFACALMFAVTIGWKTKLSALALAIYLFFMNIYINPWWAQDYHSSHRDLYKYDFFQTFSIIGGLLLLISLGPGKVSLDHSRRNL